jgi:uncharacterized membrane-anchored protein
VPGNRNPWSSDHCSGGLALAAPSILLQGSSTVDQPSLSPFLIGAVAFLATLFVGGLAIALVPEYVDRISDRINDNPLATLGWGILISVASSVILSIVTVVLIFTFIGILLLFPLNMFVLFLVAGANALGFVGLFARIADAQGQALLLGAAAAGVLGLLPVIGPLAALLGVPFGVGAIFTDMIG